MKSVVHVLDKSKIFSAIKLSIFVSERILSFAEEYTHTQVGRTISWETRGQTWLQIKEDLRKLRESIK